DDAITWRIKTWKWKPEAFEDARAEVAGEQSIDLADLPAIEVIDGALDAAAMRELYQSAWLFIKNANREGWGLPATEAVACGARVAATRIQPLISHLPEDTRWFELGDRKQLSELLTNEYRAFVADRDVRRGHTWAKTAELVARSLEGLSGGG